MNNDNPKISRNKLQTADYLMYGGSFVAGGGLLSLSIYPWIFIIGFISLLSGIILSSVTALSRHNNDITQSTETRKFMKLLKFVLILSLAVVGMFSYAIVIFIGLAIAI